MDGERKTDWEDLILRVVRELESHDIVYHLDGSTALFAHGLTAKMDDLDVTVKWGTLDRAREAFAGYTPTRIATAPPRSFRFEMGGRSVHVMSYPSESGIGEESDRTIVEILGVPIWCKTVAFFGSRLREDHPLREKVKSYLERSANSS